VKYDSLVDIFSMGITLYAMLYKRMPFLGGDDLEELTRNRNCEIFFSTKGLDITDEAVDFLRKTLAIDPEYRLSASEALNHPWILQTLNFSSGDKLSMAF
jgi:serine/threonine protein kinase